MAKDREGRRRAIRRFYDRLGKLLDTQSFYEQSGLDILVREGHFEQAHAVFEFGCGTGRLAEQLLAGPLPDDTTYTAIDISPRMVEITRQRLAPWQERVDVRVSDGSTRLDYPDASFDRFIATYVIDLLEEDEARELISEAHRVLRGDGRLCLVSITHGRGIFSRLLMASWKVLHRIAPILTGGCRPVCLRRLLTDTAWQVDFHDVVTRYGVAIEVLIARRQADSRFQQLVESTAAIPWEVDLSTWRFTYVGSQAEEVLGYPVEDWYAEGFWQEHIHPEDREQAMHYCMTATERGEDHEFEYRMLAADGRVVWLSDHVWILYEGGRATKLQGFMFDITRRKQDEEKLAQSEAKFRDLFNATSDAIAVIHEGVFIDCNRATLEIFGAERSDIIGASPMDFSPPTQYDGRPSAEVAQEKIAAALAMGSQVFEWRHRRKDGTIFDAEVALNPMEIDGMPCVQGNMRDITARRRQDEAVRNIAAGVAGATGEEFFSNLVTQLATIFEAAYAFVAVLDDSDPGRVNIISLYAQGQIGENFSYELEGTPCANVVGQKTCAHPHGVREEFPQDKLLTEMGIEGYIGSPLFDGRGNALGLIVVLDTRPLKQFPQAVELMEIFAARTGAELERLRIEAHLRKSEALLQLVLDSIPVRVFWKDRDSVYLGCNKHFAHDAGLERVADILGKTDFELGWREQAELYRNDDRQVIDSALAKLDYEEPQTTPEGEQRWLRTSKIPLRDSDDQVFGVLGIYEDITERKHTEEALRRSQKMEAIGQLSGGIAHDFNNQLGVVIGYLDFLRNRHQDDTQQQQWVDAAARATLRCMDLTRQLLAFSRRQARELRSVDINAALRELETMIARSVTPEVEVQYQLAPDAWRTGMDPGEFQDAILNLVINARDAMPRGGRLRIETRNLRLDSEGLEGSPDLPPGDYVQLLVSDSGSGMDSRTLERVFEPFFTTKPEGKGTGLGLAMVYGFARRYGGDVEVFSEPGVGTTFCLNLPRDRRAGTESMRESPTGSELPRGNEAILVVDDERDLLHLAEIYLRDLGYRVYTAENAAQAMSLLESDVPLDLLFSDVVMPGGMNGYELARRSKQLRPELPVLLTSGFTTGVLSSDEENVAATMLAKPYRKDELALQVRQVLDDSAATMGHAEKAGLVTSLEGIRVLVVDDEEDVRKLFELKLQRLGVDVETVASGEEAVERVRQALQVGDAYTAMILDLSLPGGMGGAEAARQIHALDADACLIVSSGDPEAPAMRDPAAHGFAGALAKDAEPATLQLVLEGIVAGC